MENKKPFVCPYCKKSDGWMLKVPQEGFYYAYFDKFGELIKDESVTWRDKEETEYFCENENCGETITEEVKKYLETQKVRGI